MRNLIRTLRHWLQGARMQRQPHAGPQVLQKMARQLAATHEVEYACDDVLRLLDQVAEAFLRGENVAKLWPLVLRHLDMCPDCREEFEALLRILRASPA